MEVLWVLGFFAIVLAIVTVVGHGIWVAIASIFKSTGNESPTSEIHPSLPLPTLESDLKQTYATVDRLFRAGIVDRASFEAIAKSIRSAAQESYIELPPIVAKLSQPEPQLVDLRSRQSAGAGQIAATGTAPPPLTLGVNPITDAAPSGVPGVAPLHALDRDYEPEPPRMTQVVAAKSQRALGDMLQQFLSEKNIHWGELLSGLLIVGSAVGLILSLRTELSRLIPMFPSVLFFLVTVAIHLAGFYTLKQWKLPSTSRGLLVLGSMMMPITALATCLLAHPNGDASLTSISFLAPTIIGGVGFGILTYFSGQHLFPSNPILWSLSLVAGSLVPGFVNRLAVGTFDNFQFGWLSALAMAALGLATASLVPISFSADATPQSRPTLESQLRLFGIALFATIIAVGLLLFRTRPSLQSVVPFAVPASLSGALLMCAGSHFARQGRLGVADRQPTDSSKIADTVVVLGTSLVMLGGALFLMAIGLAGPDAKICLLTSMMNLVLAIGLALLWNHPAMTAIASLFGSIGVFLLVQRWQGNFPETSISPEWLGASLPTVVTASTFMVLSIASGALGFVTSYVFGGIGSRDKNANVKGNWSLKLGDDAWDVSHQATLFTAAIIQCVIGFAIAGYLGATSRSEPQLIFAIGSMSVIAIGTLVIGRYLQHAATLVLGSILLLIPLCILARVDTDLAVSLGTHQWRLRHAILLVTLLHAALILIAMHVLPLIPSKADSKSSGDAMQLLGSTGILSALASFPFLIVWNLPDEWRWQGVWLASISVIFFAHWLMGFHLGRKSEGESGLEKLDSVEVPIGGVEQASSLGEKFLTREFEHWGIQFLSIIAACFAICFAGASAQQQLLSPRFLPDMLFASAVASIALAAAILACVARQFPKLRWMVVLRSPFGDAACLILVVYQQVHFWSKWREWSGTVRMGATLEAEIWTGVLMAVLIASFLLASIRNREFYIWLSGFLSLETMFVVLVTWFPNGRDVIAFLYLLCSSPLLIALGFAVWDAVRLLRSKDPKDLKLAPAIYEFFVGVFTLVLWAIFTGSSFFLRFVEPNANPFGLLTGAGVYWLLLGMMLFALRSLLEKSVRFVVLFQLGSLLVFLHFPIALIRMFDIAFDKPTFLAVMMVGASLHAIALVWFSVQGYRLTRAILAPTNLALVRPPERALDLNRKHVVAISTLVLVASVIFVFLSEKSDLIRLIALSVAMIGFALLALDKFYRNTTNWVAIIRHLIMVSTALFIVYFVWSGVEQSTWPNIWCSRILRLTSVILAVNLSLAAIYAWITSTLSSEESVDHQAANPNVAIHLSHWLTFSKSGIVSSWRNTMTQNWLVASVAAVGCLTLGIIWMVALVNKSAGASANTGRAAFAAETLWVVGLSIVWIVQLVVQAIRHRWNVAQFYPSTRSSYVYLAEVVFCLAAVQLYLVFPDWFRLPLREYWPIILLVIAVAGQGIAQLLKRSGVDTVGEPLSNTSLLMPVIASVGMMVFATEASPDTVLALGALFYFFMGATEQSRQLAMLGGIFSNIGLLFFWDRFDGLDFSAHPQLWLIPPAASIAIATHFERDRLSGDAKVWIRYVAMATIFLSSSGEILMRGLGTSLWPPMVLMLLSVITAFLGISFQVRSYLYSGLLFTLMALIAMVAHAQQSLNHTWPWWALGISLGIGILVLFGLFEKKREEFHKVAARLKGWEG